MPLRIQTHRPELWNRMVLPVSTIVQSLMQRIHQWAVEWRQFKQSFVFPSSIETRKRTRLHDKVRRLSWPALHYAAFQGRTYYVETLLKKFDVNKKDCEKVTPLHCAIRGGNPDTILTLLSAGADVSAADFRGQTPLYWAAYFGNVLAIQLLIKFGANVNQVDLRGKTALRAAAKYGCWSAVSTLISAGANVNALDCKKQTPYYCAALHGRIETMNVLRLFRADPSVVNIDGKTAMQAIARSSYWTYFNYRWQVKAGHCRHLTDEQLKALQRVL